MRRVDWASDLFVCRQTFTLSQDVAKDYEEFRSPCEEASVSRTDDGNFEIRATKTTGDGQDLCTIKLAFDEDFKITQTVSVSKTNAMKIRGVFGWNCVNKQTGIGKKCYNTNFSKLDYERVSVMSNYTQLSIYHSKDDDDQEMSGGIGLSVPELEKSLRLGSGMKDVLIIIGYVLGGVLVILLVVLLIFGILRCWRNKATIDTIKTVALKEL